MKTVRIGLLLAGLLPLVGSAIATGDASGKPAEGLHLSVQQKECLWLEPVLVSVRLQSERLPGLPALPGKSKAGTLRFDITPAVKARPNAKPLPLESAGADMNVPTRRYDLFELFTFPNTGGTWTVKVVLEQGDVTLTSAPVTFSIRQPEKGSAEVQPVARIHHTPWSNYDTNAFCGDTFDLVARWPSSRLAPYCHYWNGRYSQNKKEYAKAIASYRTAAEKYPDFVLSADAEYGVVECLVAQGKLAEAQKVNAELRAKLPQRCKKAGIPGTSGETVVDRLAQRMSESISRQLARER